MKDSKDIFYVYAYLDPRKAGEWSFGDLELGYEPFYIGKGKENRLNSHLNEAKKINYVNISNPEKTQRIRDILKEIIEPIIIKLVEDLDENTSLRIERNTIKLFGRKDKGLGPLLNLTDGGEGVSGYVMSEKQKKQVSKVHKGKKISDYHKRRITLTLTGRKHTKESKRKMSESQKGRKVTEETKEKISRIVKEQYKNGRIHPLLGIGHSKETKEKLREYRLNREYTENDKEGQKKRVESMIERRLTVGVRQLDLEGNVLNIFPSMHSTARETGISYNSIRKAINKGYTSQGLYKFERLNYSTKRITN